MNDFDSDDLPRDLDEVGARMRSERPVASDQALDRAITRAQARPRRSSRLLWTTHAPRVPKMSLALGAAAVIALGGFIGLGGTSTPPGTSNDASLVAYTTCSSGQSTIVHLDGGIGTNPLDVIANIRLLEGLPNNAPVILIGLPTLDLSTFPPTILVTYCVNL